MGLVSYEQGKLPPPTPEELERARKLAGMPDSEIDYSDIPPLDDEFWKNAVRNPFLPQNAQTGEPQARVDADVWAWLKSRGGDCQERLNNILREAMRRETAAE